MMWRMLLVFVFLFTMPMQITWGDMMAGKERHEQAPRDEYILFESDGTRITDDTAWIQGKVRNADTSLAIYQADLYREEIGTDTFWVFADTTVAGDSIRDCYWDLWRLDGVDILLREAVFIHGHRAGKEVNDAESYVPSSIDGSHVEDLGLTGDDLDSLTVESHNLNTGCVTSDKVLDGTLGTADYGDTSITSGKLDTLENVVVSGSIEFMSGAYLEVEKIRPLGATIDAIDLSDTSLVTFPFKFIETDSVYSYTGNNVFFPNGIVYLGTGATSGGLFIREAGGGGWTQISAPANTETFSLPEGSLAEGKIIVGMAGGSQIYYTTHAKGITTIDTNLDTLVVNEYMQAEDVDILGSLTVGSFIITDDLVNADSIVAHLHLTSEGSTCLGDSLDDVTDVQGMFHAYNSGQFDDDLSVGDSLDAGYIESEGKLHAAGDFSAYGDGTIGNSAGDAWIFNAMTTIEQPPQFGASGVGDGAYRLWEQPSGNILTVRGPDGLASSGTHAHADPSGRTDGYFYQAAGGPSDSVHVYAPAPVHYVKRHCLLQVFGTPFQVNVYTPGVQAGWIVDSRVIRSCVDDSTAFAWNLECDGYCDVTDTTRIFFSANTGPGPDGAPGRDILIKAGPETP